MNDAHEPHIEHGLRIDTGDGGRVQAGRHNSYRHLSNAELLDHPAVIKLREMSDAAEEMAQRMEDYAAGNHQFSDRHRPRRIGT